MSGFAGFLSFFSFPGSFVLTDPVLEVFRPDIDFLLPVLDTRFAIDFLSPGADLLPTADFRAMDFLAPPALDARLATDLRAPPAFDARLATDLLSSLPPLATDFLVVDFLEAALGVVADFVPFPGDEGAVEAGVISSLILPSFILSLRSSAPDGDTVISTGHRRYLFPAY